MKKANVYALAAVLLLVVAISAFVAVVNNSNTSTAEAYGPKKPFHLGVTYCGASVEEAKQLIDRVKNYTNLFVIQSDYLQLHLQELENICDYAVNSELDIIVYFSAYQIQKPNLSSVLAEAQTRWDNHFLGVYYTDEPGGKMLDIQVDVGNITKYSDGGVKRINYSNDTFKSETYFSTTGSITISSFCALQTETSYKTISQNTVYLINGTIARQTDNTTIFYGDKGNKPKYEISTLFFQQDGTVQDENGKPVSDQGNITQFVPHRQLWDSRPLQTYAEVATAYTNNLQEIVSGVHNQSSVKVFTADYALYWFDYKGGYDTVLAELGPANNTLQEIALIRGAANMHNKQWGTILSWTNSKDPATLMSGNELYENLKLSYESGADYGVVFNYAPDSNGTGLLQDEHFTAIKQFWAEVVQNPDTTNNLTVRTAYVLPADYGWGMRTVNDTVWGLFPADEKATEIWSATQNLLSSTNGRIDIIYEDSASQATTRYSVVHYWNST
jgi:hypothetical protein